MKLSCQIAAVAAFAVTLTSSAVGQVSPGRSAWVDLAALGDREIRVGMEPLRMGAFTLNVMFSNRDNSRGMDTPTGAFAASAPIYAYGSPDRVLGSEWMLDVGTRFYTNVVRAGSHLRYGTYAGASVGLHRRSGDLPQCQARVCPAIRYNLGNGDGPVVAYGFEPSAEAGVHFLPSSAIVLDVGLRARVIAFADPVGNYSVGEVVPRMTVSAGVNW